MKIKLENVRLSFPFLFNARDYKGDGKFAYSAKALVVPGSENDKKIRAAIEQIAKEKWPKKWERMLEEFRPDRKAYPYIDGARADFDGAGGMWVLSTKRRQANSRPLVLDSDKSPLVESDGKPYAGCYVHMSVEFWAQDGDSKGIRCELRGVQFYRDGEAFGGGSKPSEDEFDSCNADLV